MKIISSICILAALCYADSRKVIFTGHQELRGITVRFETVLESASDAPDSFWTQGHGGGFRTTSNVEHRFLWDEATRSYFGYDLKVESTGASGNCRISISPLSLPLEVLRDWPRQPDVANPPGYRLLALPTYPNPPTVRPGDTLAVNLLESPDHKQKVVDYINVSRADAQPRVGNVSLNLGGGVPPEAQPRDFTVENVTLRIVRPEVMINGKQVD